MEGGDLGLAGRPLDVRLLAGVRGLAPDARALHDLLATERRGLTPQLGLLAPPHVRHRAASIELLTKLYAGHGPVSSTLSSQSRYSAASSSTARRNSSLSRSSTR